MVGMITDITDGGFRNRAADVRFAKEKNRVTEQFFALVIANGFVTLAGLAGELPFQIFGGAAHGARPLRFGFRPERVESGIEFFDRADSFIFLETRAKRREREIDGFA